MLLVSCYSIIYLFESHYCDYGCTLRGYGCNLRGYVCNLRGYGHHQDDHEYAVLPRYIQSSRIQPSKELVPLLLEAQKQLYVLNILP